MANNTPDRSKLVALVDSDTWIYLAAYGAERSIEWDPGFWTTTGNMHDALAAWEIYLGRFSEYGTVVPFLSQDKEDYWRARSWPTYKANRTQGKVPFLMPILKAWLLENIAEKYGGIVKPGDEADDLVGIAAVKADNRIVFSADKDLKQIPGLHGDIEDPHATFTVVTPKEGHAHWLLQSLMGDTTDNYPGIPGVGAKTAAKLLSDTPTIDEVFDIYKTKKQTPEHAHAMLSVARILQSRRELDPKTGLVNLDYLRQQEARIYE